MLIQCIPGKKPRIKVNKRDLDCLTKARDIASAIAGVTAGLGSKGEAASAACDSLAALIVDLEAGSEQPKQVESAEGQQELPFVPAEAAAGNF